MDLVNSVTQNSNNKNVTMENQPPNYNDSSNSYEMSNKADQNDESAMSQVPPIGASERNQIPEYLRVIGMDPKKFWPKKYRFTREKTPGQYNPLSVAERNFYENNGYLVLDGCNSQRLIDAIKADYERSLVVSEFLVEKLVAKNDKLLLYVKCFCDERLMLMTHRVVETFRQTYEQAKANANKSQQAAAQRQQLVRDWIYLPFRPIDKVVCAITAIEPLQDIILVAPGTHKVGQYTTISSTSDDSSAAYKISQENSSSMKRNLLSKELFECSPVNLSSVVEKSPKGLKYVNLKPGQTLFYHPCLVHGFSDDLVNLGRRQLATIAYYAAADCEYVEMSRQQQEGDSHELMQPGALPVGLAHFQGQDPSNYHSWINRPRLVHHSKLANL